MGDIEPMVGFDSNGPGQGAGQQRWGALEMLKHRKGARGAQLGCMGAQLG